MKRKGERLCGLVAQALRTKMKLAVVINVAAGQAALSRATRTQSLLLEQMGSQLDSIRLAVPHLLQFACLGAIAEKPDLLVVVGGPKAARRAGQVAHDRDVPILFLPGMRFPPWASRLWGSLSLEGMIAALAGENVTPIRLAAGWADGHLFFDSAACGFLPQIAQLRDGFVEAEGFVEIVEVLGRAVHDTRVVFRPDLRIQCRGTSSRLVSALLVCALGSEDAASTNATVTRLRSLACSAWRYGAASLIGAIFKSVVTGNWRTGTKAERFDCTQLTVDAGAKPWLLLDGEPLRFQGPIEFRFLPKAIKTFAFAPERVGANDNDLEFSRSRFAEHLRQRGRNPWNPRPPSHVRYGGRN